MRRDLGFTQKVQISETLDHLCPLTGFFNMALQDLIAFVQDHYASRDGIPNHRQPAQNTPYERAPGDLNASPGGRPPLPDWLSDEDEESGSLVTVIGAGPLDLDTDGFPVASGTQPRETEPSIDTLAYYLPYHFYPEKWGVYLRASGILYLASVLKEAAGAPADAELLELSRRILFEHEFFHFIAETACSQAEVVANIRLYEPYFPNPYAAPHEEALANAYACRRAMRGRSAHIKAQVSTWMSRQPEGYRDYHRWLTRARFDTGCRRAAHYMLQPIPITGPGEFLLALSARTTVPTRLVNDTKAGTVKPFPKHLGMRVVVHTREHPPPHIHIERPRGRVVTRYVWPDLTPYPGDKALASSAEKDLRNYLKEYGPAIEDKVRSVYPAIGVGR
jgi:hypothetical protein